MSCGNRFHSSPPNIVVVPPESDMSTYALMSLCNCGIIYGTKMGVELTSTGLPVIVAGEAWIRNKGLTWTPARLRNTSQISTNCRFKERLGARQLARARQYAYHFFFNRMIPLRLHRARRRDIRFTGSSWTAFDISFPARPKDWIQSATGFSSVGRSLLARTGGASGATAVR